MFLDKVLNRTKVLEKSLDAAWLRNEVVSNNISNVDTPGYKKKSVEFEQYLNEAIDKSSFKGFRTDSRHIQIGGTGTDSVEAKVVTDSTSLNYRQDGNNVDIESEMAAMAKNSIQYNTMIQSISSKFQSIKSAINEGRK